jgi:hypothetical protein
MEPRDSSSDSRPRRTSWGRSAVVGLTVALVVVASLLLAGCKSGGALEPYQPTGQDITVTSPAGAQQVLKGEDADLYCEIQYIREALASGRVKWDSEALMQIASEFGPGDPSPQDTISFLDTLTLNPIRDPASVLDDAEASLFKPSGVTVYVVRTATREQALALQTELQGASDVQSATLVTKEEALELMKANFQDNPELLEDLPRNPFPDKIVVTLKSDVSLDEFVAQYTERAEVDDILADEVSGASQVYSQMPFELLRVLVYAPYYYEKVYE